MTGTLKGGLKTAETNKQKDPDYYKKIGAMGGKISRGGGFGSNKKGKDGLTGKERAIVAGAKGGRKERVK